MSRKPILSVVVLSLLASLSIAISMFVKAVLTQSVGTSDAPGKRTSVRALLAEIRANSTGRRGPSGSHEPRISRLGLILFLVAVICPFFVLILFL